MRARAAGQAGQAQEYNNNAAADNNAAQVRARAAARDLASAQVGHTVCMLNPPGLPTG